MHPSLYMNAWQHVRHLVWKRSVEVLRVKGGFQPEGGTMRQMPAASASGRILKTRQRHTNEGECGP